MNYDDFEMMDRVLIKQTKKTSIYFAEWIHKNLYTVYWGSDKPNCDKWYIYGTMPDREYLTSNQLYDKFISEIKQ